MLVKIAITLAILFAIFILIVLSRPAAFRIVRSAVMAAPARSIFDELSDFHRWDAWSPWASLDPAMTKTYTGPLSGPGASFGWSGNAKAGEGRMTVTESRPAELMRCKLEFMRPFRATNMSEFALEPQADQTAPQTRVTWAMTGNNNFMMRAMGLILNFDKLIGRDFEKGLASLKTIVEQTPRGTAI